MLSRTTIIRFIPTAVLTIALLLGQLAFGQTGTTGALTGTTSDPSRAVIPGVELTVTNEATGDSRTVLSGEAGVYTVPLLPPGSYTIHVTLPGFKEASYRQVRITVAETTRMNIQLEVGELTERITIEAQPNMVQQESSALGRAVSEVVLTSLPLLTRNYTQILALSPGITMDVTNAADLGRGSGANIKSKTSAQGARAFDNVFQVDGVFANDMEASTGGSTSGSAVPSPDTIQEFKAQTAQADASFGRAGGANVNIITKSGSNAFHGTAFDFLRNEALNANDFFFNRVGKPRPVMRQNQFGGVLGGPILRDKLFFFGSYQGTRQTNGLGTGQDRAKCSATILSPPLTNDRSAAALGALFAGRSGQQGGVAIRSDGSNINPVALRLLQRKSPDGSYLMPTPQVINRSRSIDTQGVSLFSDPCTFTEDQFMTNFDFLHTDSSKLMVRFFHAGGKQSSPYPTAASNVKGFSADVTSSFVLASVAHSYILGPSMFNELRIGYFRNTFIGVSKPSFLYPDIGVNAAGIVHQYPGISIAGSYNISSASICNLPQRNFHLRDDFSYLRGVHSLRFGGDILRLHTNVDTCNRDGQISFLSFPDFLLGMDGVSNGSGFSNIFSSTYRAGDFYRHMRYWDGSAYIQDDIKLTARLTLNVGFRYDRLSHPSDTRGKQTNFDFARADPNPPASGTLKGYIVPRNFFSNDIPAGVIQSSNDFSMDREKQSAFAPRFGFALQLLPSSSRLLLRGGYGVYYSRVTSQAYWQGLAKGMLEFAGARTGAAAAFATFENPFLRPVPTSFPAWSLAAYSPSTSASITTLAQDFRPAMTHQYSLNIQTEVMRDTLLEIGYVGTKGVHLGQPRSLNQASLASPTNPIRGQTTNTVANAGQRVPILGFQAIGLKVLESTGSTWYNALQTSLTKRMSRGLQFLASHTWSKSLDTAATNSFGAHLSGTMDGDQNDFRQGYGRGQLNRSQRFVFSYVYELPISATQRGLTKKIFGGWSVTGVTTIQSGASLSFPFSNPNNVFGITTDRAQLAPGCTHQDLVTAGSIKNNLDNYFNKFCFTRPVVIGDDSKATAFGNSGAGIVAGPGQHNFDAAVTRRFPLQWNEQSRLEFRAELFNVFNTAQFTAPNTNFTAADFGHITSTSVNSRMLQFALRLNF